MEYNSEILQELKEISPLLSQIKNKNPYTATPAYFDQLPQTVLNKLKTDDEALPSFTRLNPYAVPSNYFANLSNFIFEKINIETGKSEVIAEMEGISPLLNTISKKQVYSIPPDYFDKLAVSNNVPVENHRKHIYFARSKKVLTYAIAAIIIGLLSVGIFLVTGKERTTTAANMKSLQEVNRLSEQEIVDFLKTTSPAENVVTNSSKSSKKDVDIKRMLDEMSDKEIQQFLEENGEKNEM